MIRDVGLLAKPGDTKGFAKNLIDILKDEKKKKELQKKSLDAFNKKYNLTTTTKQYEQYYNKFL
jgi:glycosyltransferase involved in cell wall biosynthesis